jgi:dihydroorotase
MAAARARYGDDVPVDLHGELRSRESCLKSTRLALELARRHDARLHVLHISTADELALFEPGPLIRADGSRKRITAETCVHFLRFDRRDYATRGNFIKCNPSIKDPSDREALLRALADDRIDVLATDHAPHTLAEKQQPYLQAPSGLPLVQDALRAGIECVLEGHFPLAQLVQKVCHAPAQLFDVAERGFLREGDYADLVLVDPRAPHTVKREEVLSRCGWSPFEGVTFRSSIVATWVNGALAWDGKRLIGPPNGQRLRFAR